MIGKIIVGFLKIKPTMRYLALFFLVMILACSKHTSQQINMPTNLDVLCIPNGTKTFRSSNRKLIHYFTADCSVCLSEIDEWKRYLKTVETDSLDVIFIATTEDKDIARHYLKEIDFESGVLLDQKKDFIRLNGLSQQNYTFLTDSALYVLCSSSKSRDTKSLEVQISSYLRLISVNNECH